VSSVARVGISGWQKIADGMSETKKSKNNLVITASSKDF
jgi:hypothetical protein